MRRESQHVGSMRWYLPLPQDAKWNELHRKMKDRNSSVENRRGQSRWGNSRHKAKQVPESELLLRVERPQACKIWRTLGNLLPGLNTFKFVAVSEPQLPAFLRSSQKGGKSHLAIVNLVKRWSEKMESCRIRKEYFSFTLNACWKPSICRLKFSYEMLFSSVPSFWTSLSPRGQLFSPREDWCWDPLVPITSKWIFSVCQQIITRGEENQPQLVQNIIFNILHTSAFAFLFNLSTIIGAKKEHWWNRSNQSSSLITLYW